MLIKTVKLENIRSYTSQTIEFKEGTTLLLGNIGSGKSSILQAIEFAIFGNQKGVIQASSLLRHGTSNGNITVTLDIDGTKVIISRSLKRGKGITQDAGYIEVDGVRHDGVVTELKSKIFSLLNYDENTKAKSLLFRYTVYTPQEEMKAIIFEPPEIRMNIMRKVFNLDKYKLIQENVVLYQKELRVRKRVMEKSVESYSALLEKRSQIKEKEKEILSLIKKKDKELLEHDMLFKKKQEALHKAQKDVDGIKVLENKIELVKTKLQSTQDKRNTLLIQCKDHKYNIQNIEHRYGELTSRKKRFFIIYDSLIEQFSFVQTRDVKEAFQHIDTAFKKVEDDEAKMQERHKELSKRYTKSKTMLASVQEKVALGNKQLFSLEQDVELLQKSKAAKERQLKKITIQELPPLAELKEELQKCQQHQDTFMTKHAQFTTRRSALMQEIESFSSLDSCPLCKQEVPHKHKTHIVAELKEKIVKIDTNVEKITTNLQVLKKKHHGIQEKIDATQKMHIQKVEQKQLQTRIAELSEEEKTKTKQIRALKEQHVELMSNLASLQTLVEQQEIAIKAVAVETDKLSAQRQTLYAALDDAKEMIAQSNNQKEDEKRKQESLEKVTLLEQELHNVEVFMKEGEEEIVTLQKQIDSSQAQKNYDIQFQTFEKQRKAMEDIRIALERQKSDLTHTKELVQEKTEQITAMDTEKKQLQKVTSLLTWLDTYFMHLLRAIERKVLSFYKIEFEHCFADYFSKIVDDTNMQVFIDDSFSPRVVQNGYDVPVADLSGGEKTSVSLAYRLALFKVINAFVDNAKTRDVLILDEPTDGFSDAQLDKLRDIFWDLRVKQLIIVSHESKLETFAQHFIRVEKIEHVSRLV